MIPAQLDIQRYKIFERRELKWSIYQSPGSRGDLDLVSDSIYYIAAVAIQLRREATCGTPIALNPFRVSAYKLDAILHTSDL